MSSVVIIGAQWGDEGKGKIVDALAERAEVVVRFQGGDNAGHTVYCDGRKVVFHILPSGILRPTAVCVIGGGVVLNPDKLVEELATVNVPEAEWRKRLRISAETHLILPCHIAMDRQAETRLGTDKLGTTLRGIGPAYTDRSARIGVRIADTLDPAHFRRRLAICLEPKRAVLPADVAQEVCDVERVATAVLEKLKPFADLIVDSGALLDEARRQKRNVLFEGAQGAMLDLSAGTYPYVTSSHTIAGGVCVGTGVGPHALDTILGVTKAYTTRVGEGPFPSELKDALGEKIREIGGEYGATTRRPRRCGWLDLVQLKYAVRVNSLDGLVMTKLDVLDSLDKIGLCVGYRCGSRRYTEFPFHPLDLSRLEPEYEYLEGWKAPTSAATTFEQLPAPTQRYIQTIEQRLGVPITMVSAGKDRSQLIVRQPAYG